MLTTEGNLHILNLTKKRYFVKLYTLFLLVRALTKQLNTDVVNAVAGETMASKSQSNLTKYCVCVSFYKFIKILLSHRLYSI